MLGKIYRCWIVYSKITMMVILPIIIWIGSVITGTIVSIGMISSLNASTLATTASQIKSFYILFTILTVIQNILTTCLWLTHAFQLLILSTVLIVHRIWTIAGKKYSSHSPLQGVTRIIIESGMVYSVTVLTFLACLLVDSADVYITSRIVRSTFFAVWRSHWCIYSWSRLSASLSTWL